MNLEDGTRLVKLARASIDGCSLEVSGFDKESGVFVTVNDYPSGKLRGCIGFPNPVMPLGEAVAKAARSAAFADPRFKPLGKGEKYTIELSVLSSPKRITKDILSSFEIGKHGLVVEYRGSYGLLLPQVFSEWKATPLRAVEMACEKAGVDLDSWKRKDCRIYKFEAQIFIEESPNGGVEMRK